MAVEQDSEVLDEFEPEDFKRQAPTQILRLGSQHGTGTQYDNGELASYRSRDVSVARVSDQSPSPDAKTNFNNLHGSSHTPLKRPESSSNRQKNENINMWAQSASVEKNEEGSSENFSDFSASGSDVESWGTGAWDTGGKAEDSSSSPVRSESSSATKTTTKRKGSAPRRALGAPVRAEDEDEGYIDNRGRDPEWGIASSGSSAKRKSDGSSTQTLVWKQKKPNNSSNNNNSNSNSNNYNNNNNSAKGGIVSAKSSKAGGGSAGRASGTKSNSTSSASKGNKKKNGSAASHGSGAGHGFDGDARAAATNLVRAEWFVNTSLKDIVPLASGTQGIDASSGMADVSAGSARDVGTTVRMRASDVRVPLFSFHALQSTRAHHEQKSSEEKASKPLMQEEHNGAQDGSNLQGGESEEGNRRGRDEAQKHMYEAASLHTKYKEALSEQSQSSQSSRSPPQDEGCETQAHAVTSAHVVAHAHEAEAEKVHRDAACGVDTTNVDTRTRLHAMPDAKARTHLHVHVHVLGEGKMATPEHLQCEDDTEDDAEDAMQDDELDSLFPSLDREL